ncbi:serine/threonine protein kinase [Candidatus Poribacteria bacterium]|nr:serine/threonine protein kinase [Candidatus Poribacteria bacterium]
MPKPQVRLVNERYALAPNPISGGMANVYRANDMHEEGRQVAVKLFEHGHLEEEILAEAFKREVQAYKEVKHPGIVELLDSGIDEETGYPFLVLEWMNSNLSEYVKESPPEGWDTFAETVAIPLLEALAFAHTRLLIHRDIKPSNILINANGKPKLADFGISKLKRLLQPGRTLAEFASRPYTPPEYDDGLYTYTRDVFGFAVVVLDCLTDVNFLEYSDIDKALDEFDAPPEVVDVIERAVSKDPADRQNNAGILLEELQDIQRQRADNWIIKRPCYLNIPSQRILRQLQTEIGVERQEEIQSIILEDLNTDCGIRFFRSPDQKNTGNEFCIFGVSYRYHVAVNNARPDSLVILHAWSSPSSILEEERESAWSPLRNYEFSFERPRDGFEAEEVIRDLRLAVDEHEAKLKLVDAERREQYLFRVWNDILRAKSDAEKIKQVPIKYKDVNYQDDSNRVTFHLSQIPEESLIGQPRQVTLSDGGYLKGEVDEVRDDELILYVEHGNPNELPKSGELTFDTHAAMIALDRQKAALDAVRFDRALRFDLRSLLIHPETICNPKTEEDMKFVQSMDEVKQNAVRAALGIKDFLIIEGPPGTGKTMFIVEVVLQNLQRNPDSRILLTSQTHVALDNALEHIHNINPELKLVRIGHLGDKRISPGSENLLLENQMERWRQEVLDRGKDFLSRWANARGISQYDIELATILKQLSSLLIAIENLEAKLTDLQQKLEVLNSWHAKNLQNKNENIILSEEEISLDGSNIQIHKENSTQQYDYVDSLKEDISLVKSELQSMRKEKKTIQEQLEKMEWAELSQLSYEDLESWVADLIRDNPDAKKLQKLLSIHAEWTERFGRGKEFHAAFLKRSQVIAGTCIGIAGVKNFQDIEFDRCIVDEASKATATEILVPLSRSRSWILVGDHCQLPPFEDEAIQNPELLKQYELTLSDLEETLFNRLLQCLSDECHKILMIQHRMVAPIGNLISECFYDGHLKSVYDDTDSCLNTVIPRPVTWLTTSWLPNHHEVSQNSSYENPCEAQVIRRILKNLDLAAQSAGKRYSIAVLNGYSAQRRLLEHTLTDRGAWERLNIECNTVDAFQGREADIAIYSVTRSNVEGKIGFLHRRERLNVALSRGRYGLIIVGDHSFCRTTSGDSPLKQVLDYIENHPKDCALEEFNLNRKGSEL